MSFTAKTVGDQLDSDVNGIMCSGKDEFGVLCNLESGHANSCLAICNLLLSEEKLVTAK